MSAEKTSQTGDGSGMVMFGALLLLVGIASALYAFSMDTSVRVSADLSSIVGAGGVANTVNNIGLMQQQMMILHTGLAFSIAGSLALFLGLAVHSLKK